MLCKGIKISLYILSCLALSLGFGEIAYAEPGIGWSAGGMSSEQGITPDTDAVGMEALAASITQGATVCCGIAIVLFVFRIVLTAVDKMVVQDTSTINLRFKYLGSYGDKDWREIFKYFALQLAIVAGAWIIVNAVTGLALQLLALAPS